MNLLVLNPKTDRRDSGLEVAVEWIEALAARVDHVYVITNHLGDPPLASNVTIRSLGRERGAGRARRAAAFYCHLRNILREAPIHACFVHMVPQLAVMAGPVVAAKRIPLVQWYTHRSTPWSLRVALRLADKVVTASAESFHLASDKVVITGHGIDTARFRPDSRMLPPVPLGIITVGRLAPVKRLEVLLDAIAQLVGERLPCRLEVIGEGRDPTGRAYGEELRRRVQRLRLEEVVTWTGALARGAVVEHYQRAHVCVNLSDTDSLDKAGLEAMACGIPVVTSNLAFEPLLGDIAHELLVPKGDPAAVAARLRQVAAWPASSRALVGDRLRARVIERHDLGRLADRLVELFRELSSAR